MQFSDTTNKSGMLQRIEMTLGFPDGRITSDTTQLAYFTTLVNESYYDVVSNILSSQDTWDFDDSNLTDFPVATTPLVASQRMYTLPTDYTVLKLKRVDVSYDGSTYYQSTAADSAEFDFGLGTDSKEDNNFTKTAPVHDMKYNTIWLYPMAEAADVAAGAKVRVEWSRTVNEFTTADTTQEPGFDRPWHELVPLGASAKYAAMKNMENAKNLKVLLDEKMLGMRAYYSRKQEDKNPILIQNQVGNSYGK